MHWRTAKSKYVFHADSTYLQVVGELQKSVGGQIKCTGGMLQRGGSLTDKGRGTTNDLQKWRPGLQVHVVIPAVDALAPHAWEQRLLLQAWPAQEHVSHASLPPRSWCLDQQKAPKNLPCNSMLLKSPPRAGSRTCLWPRSGQQ